MPPADAEIEAAIAAVTELARVPRSGDYTVLDGTVTAAYIAAVAGIPLGTARELTVAYTPMHGVGGATLAAAFETAGFTAPVVVGAQAAPDPDFPTVPFPNPEEPGALDLVRALAGEVGADVVIANDPDADRCAVAAGGGSCSPATSSACSSPITCCATVSAGCTPRRSSPPRCWLPAVRAPESATPRR